MMAALQRRDFLWLGIAAASLAAAATVALLFAVTQGFWDFDVFYSSGRAALHGVNFYTTYGDTELPYWYFPWLAWFFAPFALLPESIAKALYLALSAFSLAFVVRSLGRRLNPQMPMANQMFAAAMGIFMSMLLFVAGQMDFILLGVVVAVMLLLEDRRHLAAGLLFPLLLFKPHLLGVFLPFLFYCGGRRFSIAALGSLAVVATTAIVIMPAWPSEMIRMLTTHGGRSDNFWNFTTLPQLLGLTENWSGTANLPMTAGLFIVGLFVAWRYRRLPMLPLLALTLSASMLCAPRAYSYNLPFLIPPLLWVSAHAPRWGPFLWLGAGAAGMAALVVQWSAGGYLIILAVFVMAVLQARRSEQVPLVSQPATR